MGLLDLLGEEAARRGLLAGGMELNPARVFALVRDMPYERASSRDPETTILEWRGTCSGKHYLLKALFAELGIHSRLIACSTQVDIDPADVPEELRPVVDDAGGRIVDVHNYLVLELADGDMVVDATFPVAMKGLGFPVNEGFVLGEDQEVACTPIGIWEVPEDVDSQQFKRDLLGRLFTEKQLAERDRFILALSSAVAKRLQGGG
jgi:hypothetical protein